MNDEQAEYLSNGAYVVDKQVANENGTLTVKQVIGDSNLTYILMDFVAPEGTVLNSILQTKKRTRNGPLPSACFQFRGHSCRMLRSIIRLNPALPDRRTGTSAAGCCGTTATSGWACWRPVCPVYKYARTAARTPPETGSLT